MATTTIPDHPALAPWVVLHEDRCRGGRRHTVAVNRRDGRALTLEGDEAALCRRLDGTRAAATLAPDDLLATLHEGGFLTDRPACLDAPPARRTVRTFLATLDAEWQGADRLVRALHRRGLRLLLTPAAVAAQVVLAVAGLAALVAVLGAGHDLEVRAGAGHVPVLLALGLGAVLVHELGHALVLVHHGGSVRAAGFRLHLGTPAFYVDSVDALLLPRRVRLVQAAAGPWAEWLVTSVAVLVLWRWPAPALVPVLYRFVCFNTVCILSNLLPFVGMDGSWILADAVGEPDLRQRSTQALSALVRPPGRRRRPPLEQVVLAAYAVLNAAVGAALLALAAFFWMELFGSPLAAVVRLGPLGWLAAGTLVAALVQPALAAGGAGVLRRCRPVPGRVRFRLERRWRVAATRRLLALPEVTRLGERGLGVLAGGLERAAAVAPGFDGLVLPAAGRRQPLVLVPAAVLALAGAVDRAA